MAEEQAHAEGVLTGVPQVALLACTRCGVLLWDIEKHYAHAHPEPGGAHPAATFTPEQVEAAARAIQDIEHNAGNVAGIEWCRLRVQATFAAAGFQIEAARIVPEDGAS